MTDFSSVLLIHLLAYCQSQLFDANVSYEWSGQNINCNNDTSCTVNCDQTASCYNSTVNCPINNQCIINCPVTSSCSEITINPPRNQSLFSLKFSGSYALHGAQYPIYKVDDYTPFTLKCDIANQCSGMIITCPRFAHCNISCVAAATCNQMSVEWPVIDGYGSLICEGNYACGNMNFPIPEPSTPYSVQCDEAHICFTTYIICPANAACNITCSAVESCKYTVIICPETAECNVEFSYPRTAEGTSVYCLSNENCNVKCLNTTDACYDTRIYWSNLQPNGNVTCNPSQACNNLIRHNYVPSSLPTKQPVSPFEMPTTYQPSLSPTTSPTTSPIESISPTTIYNLITTYQPSSSPTIFSSPTIESSQRTNFVNYVFAQPLWLLVVVIIIVVVICIVLMFAYLCKTNKIKTNPNNISNALVVVITIADYENDETQHGDFAEGYFPNLPVDKDFENLQHLFVNILKYKLIPNELKLNWTEKELINFFQNDVGKELFDENDELKYDALIVCISCHGIKNHIVTSDRRKIEKAVIHRIISIKHPETRLIPRIVMFDSCDGAAQMEFIREATVTVEEFIEQKAEKTYEASANNDVGKFIQLSHIETGKPEWTPSTKNPDYKLVQVHASNIGYQAKCDIRFGSYLLYNFYNKMKDNVAQKQNKTLGEIFDLIQNELHDSGKQQTTNTYNNNTRDLRLTVNKQ